MSSAESTQGGGPLEIGDFTPPTPAPTQNLQLGADAARVHSGGLDQSIAPAADTLVVFGSVPVVEYDTNGLWTPALAAFTIKRTGYYLVMAQGLWAANGTGFRQLRVTSQVVEAGFSLLSPVSPTIPMAQGCGGPVHLVAGDFVQTFAENGSSTGAVAIGSGNRTWMGIQLVSL